MKRGNEKTNAQIDGYMGVTVRWVQKLWVRHTPATELSHPASMGKPENGICLNVGNTVILSARQDHADTAALQKRITEQTRINISYHIIHKMLRDEGLASRQSKKSRIRKWVRYERTYFNFMWHID